MEENKDATQKGNNNKGCWGCLTIFGIGEVIGLTMALSSGGNWEQIGIGILKIGPLIAIIIALLIVLGWMIIHFNDGNEGGSGGGGSEIPAPSKQTMRMLKRNIRRRWF